MPAPNIQPACTTRDHRLDRPKISACIITFNEAANIGACLASLAFCDEIVVVDSYSSDATVSIAQAAGARVIQRAFTGYRNQKDFCVAQASHDWVLCLDADEQVDAVLQQSIVRARDQGFSGMAGYLLTRMTHCYGAFLRHTAPDRLLRLFDRRRGGWRGAREIHEAASVDGRVALLDGVLLHYTYRSFIHLQTKNLHYARMTAEHHFARGKRATPGRMLWKLWLDPAWVFFRSYVLKMGFLDGWPGLIHAVLERDARRHVIVMLWLRQNGLPLADAPPEHSG